MPRRHPRFTLLATGVALAMLTFGAGQAQAATDAYKGATAGAWLTVGNWELGAIPTSTDIAVLTNAATSIGFNMNGASAASKNIGEIRVGVATGGGTAANQLVGNSSTAVGAGGGVITLSGVSGFALQNSSTKNLTISTNIANAAGLKDMNLTFGAANLTNEITSSGSITIACGIIGANGFVKSGSGAGVLLLTGTNTYTGDTIIQAGTLALGAAGTITNSPNITVASGATFDVSAATTAILQRNSQTLKASSSSATPGTIATASGKGLTLEATSALQFTAYNGANSPLTVTGAGSITLAAGNVVTVTVSGSALTASDYKLISIGSGNTTAVNGTAPTPVTVNGAGLAGGTTASLVIGSPTAGELYLHVVSTGCVNPTINTPPSNQTVCTNTTATFTVSASGTTLTYQWRKNASNLSNGSTGNGSATYSGVTTATLTINNVNSADAATSANGFDCVVTENSGGTCSVTTPATKASLTVTPVPATPGAITQGNPSGTAVCSGAVGVTYTISAVSGATTYTWTVPSGASITAGQGTTSITVTWGSTAGNVQVTAGNTCGTSSAASLALSVDAATPATPGTITQGNPSGSSVCAGASGVTYTISAVSGATTYTWTVPSGASVTTGQGTTSATVNWGTATSGNVTVTAGNSCGTSSAATLSVTVNPSPTITFGAFPTACGGATSANLPYTATTGTPDQYSIVWSVAATTAGFGDVTLASLPASPIAITVPGGAAAGIYTNTFTVKYSVGGCTSTNYLTTVTVSANPSSNITAPGGVCASSAGNLASVPSAGATAIYVWTITGGTITNTEATTAPGTNFVLFTANASGTVVLGASVTNAAGCFSTNASATVNINSSSTTPWVMSSGNYSENFSDIANWQNGFTCGNGANRYASVATGVTGTIPDGKKTTVSTATFASGSSGGVQRGTGALVFLTTGTPDNNAAAAVDLLLDFTSRSNGTLSFDWAEVNNSTGDRVNTLRVYTSTDGTTFTELTAALVFVTNNVAGSGSKTSITLPSGFNNSSTARIRFYWHNGTGGTTGSRPKISIDNVSVTACTPPATPAPTSNGPICAGSTLNLSANTTADSYSWTGPNGFTSTAQNPTVSAATTAATGTYSLTVTTGGCPSSPGTVSATVNATVTPSVSIASDHGSTTCSGQTVTFTATPTNGGASPSYVWKKNGTTVQSSSSATYVDSGLVDQDAIQVVMTSNATCASPTTATSNTITMTITASVTPSVGIAITSGANPSCSGSSVTFTATPTSGGASPTYAFKVNGSTVQSGSSATYTTTSLASGDQVMVTMTSNDPCASPTTADSSTITMSVSTPASISVQPSNQSVCSGGNASFTVTASNATGYQWKKNGSTINNGGTVSGATTATLTLTGVVAADSGASYTVAVSGTSPCAAVTSSPAATLTVNTFGSGASAANIVYQGFETSGGTWNFTSTGNGGASATTGTTDTPASSRILVGSQSFQSSNTTSALTFDALNTSGYSSMAITVRVASISGTTGNGVEASDQVKVFVALNGAAFSATPDITVSGNNNARWSYTSGTGVASTSAGTPISVAPAAGGARTTDGYSTLVVTIPNGTTGVALKIAVNNDNVNEIWCLDDIKLVGTQTGASISASPANATMCAGGSGVVLTAGPSGLSYSWSPSTGLSSATAQAPTATPAVTTTYTVTVTDGNGCTSQASQTVTVTPAPAVTADPQAATVCSNSTATFTVTATGSGLTYQWRKNGSNIADGPTGNGSTYTNTTTASMQVLNAQPADTAVQASGFDCVVSGTCTPSATSAKAALTVNAVTLTGPSNASVCKNGAASFTVVPSGGTAPYSYQWKKNGNNVGTDSATYSIASATLADAGSYLCTVTDNGGCSTTSSAATLLVNAFNPSTVLDETVGTPAATTVVSDYTGWSSSSPITFSVTASTTQSDVRTSSPSTGYTGASGNGNVFMGTAAANDRDLIISGIDTFGLSDLTLQFGLLQTRTTQPLTIEVNDGTGWTPLTVTMPGNTSWNLMALTGVPATHTLSIRFSKDTSNTNTFRLDDIKVAGSQGAASISASGPTSCSSSPVTLTASSGSSWLWSPGGATTQAIIVNSSGTYSVTITDANGCTSQASQAVTFVPSVTNPTSATKCEGEPVTFSVTGSGTGPLTYQWRKGGVNIGGATSSSYTISSVVPSDAGSYDCVVSGACSPAATSAAATLTVNSCVPDAWLNSHSYANGTSPSTIGDNGLTLLQSWLEGVDPHDPTAKLSITNVTVTAAGIVVLEWNSRQDGTTAQRVFDVYYHTGVFSNGVSWTRGLSNEVPQGNSSQVSDDVTDASITQRFYRVTIAGHTNDVASPEIVGVHRLTLVEGANYISMSMLPGTNTLLSVLGTNQLPQGASESAATVVDIWNQNSQVSGARYWLATGNSGWIHHGDNAPSNGVLLDPNKGLAITIRTGQGAQTLRTVGYVPTSNEVQTVQGTNGYTVASSTFPMPIPLNATGGGDGSGLVASGFLGGTSLSRSDNLLFFNPVTQVFDTRVWYATGDSKWHNADASITTRKLQPGEAFLIQRSTATGHAGNITWTNTVPYVTVPQLQGP